MPLSALKNAISRVLSRASTSCVASGRTQTAPHFLHAFSRPLRTRSDPRKVISSWTL
jgi:hypothetical protein